MTLQAPADSQDGAMRAMALAELRRIQTRMAVKAGFACPEPGCGASYRHQHDDVWWPPEGKPWPPR